MRLMVKSPHSASGTKDHARVTLFPLTFSHLLGISTMALAIGFWFVNPVWMLLVLSAYLFICIFVGPFVQRMQFYLPIVTRGSRQRRAVAFTFDDGPDPHTTVQLLDLLVEKKITATFFLVGKRARNHPDLVKMILERGHEVGNHTESHDVFVMLRSSRKLAEEVRDCQQTLAQFDIRPVAFRPPVGVTNPYLWRVLLESGLYCAGFRRRGRDMGNFRVRGLARRILKRVQPGDVALLHDCKPRKQEEVGAWLLEINELIDGIRQKGFEIQPLSQVIRRPVMEPLTRNSSPNPIKTFYNVIAHTDPSEIESPAARAEQEWFRSFELSIGSQDRILEIGAGMGRFTIPMARKAREVLAVDVSPGTLEILRQRAHENGIENIHTILADIRQFSAPAPFDIICSFSAFEYIPDLAPMLEALVVLVKPGGRLCFTTAHRSMFRLFAQLGNAMRQGMWLHARTYRQVEKILRVLDMEEISVSTMGMKNPVNGGLILAASARKKSPGPNQASIP